MKAPERTPMQLAEQLAGLVLADLEQHYFKGWAVLKEDAQRIVNEAMERVRSGTAPIMTRAEVQARLGEPRRDEGFTDGITERVPPEDLMATTLGAITPISGAAPTATEMEMVRRASMSTLQRLEMERQQWTREELAALARIGMEPSGSRASPSIRRNR